MGVDEGVSEIQLPVFGTCLQIFPYMAEAQYRGYNNIDLVRTLDGIRGAW
jgi:hypothetical protein